MITKDELLKTWRPAREKYLAAFARYIEEQTEQVREDIAERLLQAAVNGWSTTSLVFTKTHKDANYDIVLAEIQAAGYVVIRRGQDWEILFDSDNTP